MGLLRRWGWHEDLVLSGLKHETLVPFAAVIAASRNARPTKRCVTVTYAKGDKRNVCSKTFLAVVNLPSLINLFDVHKSCLDRASRKLAGGRGLESGSDQHSGS